MYFIRNQAFCEKPYPECNEETFHFEKPFPLLLSKWKEEVYRLVNTSHVGGEGTEVK